jgi:hypothetical protein
MATQPYPGHNRQPATDVRTHVPRPTQAPPAPPQPQPTPPAPPAT